MTPEATVTGDERSEALKHLLPFGQAVMLAVVLFATIVMAALIFSLRHDVATLEQQARKAAKAAKVAGAELAAIQAELDLAEPREPVAASGDAEAHAATRVAEVRRTPPPFADYGGARAVKVKAGGPIPTCVFRVGDADGLTACIKRSTRS